MVANKLDLYYKYIILPEKGDKSEQRNIESVETEQKSDNPLAEYQGGQNEEH